MIVTGDCFSGNSSLDVLPLGRPHLYPSFTLFVFKSSAITTAMYNYVSSKLSSIELFPSPTPALGKVERSY